MEEREQYGFVAYIDEAGHEAEKPRDGRWEWFVLSAVVCRADYSPDDALEDFNGLDGCASGSRFTKYQKLNPDRRVLAARSLSRAPVRTAHVVAHKPSLVGHLRDSPLKLYYYLSRFLIERISWICRDARTDPGDPRCMLVFSQRSGFDYSEYTRYLGRLRHDERCRIAWDHIEPSYVTHFPHNEQSGCRLADVAASAVYRAIERNERRVTDDRSARELVPTMYRPRGGRVLANGLKIFPPPAEDLVGSDPRLEWVRFYCAGTDV